MRELTDHIVPGDSANHQLKIEVVDEPGPGNANHRYEISGFDTSTNPSRKNAQGYEASYSRDVRLFQNGPIKEVGVNGTTHEAELAILIDRMKGFQAGQFACEDNQWALEHLQAALIFLQKRTIARILRGVEGTHQK